MTTSYHWTILSCGRQEIIHPWMVQMLHIEIAWLREIIQSYGTTIIKWYKLCFKNIPHVSHLFYFGMATHLLALFIYSSFQSDFSGTGTIIVLPLWYAFYSYILIIPWICYERSFCEFYLFIWNQLVFNQRLQLFVQSPQPYLLIFAWRNQMCFPNILVIKQMNIWILQNKSRGIEMLINSLC